MKYLFTTCAILSIVCIIILVTIDVNIIFMMVTIVPIVFIGAIIAFCGFFTLLYHNKTSITYKIVLGILVVLDIGLLFLSNLTFFPVKNLYESPSNIVWATEMGVLDRKYSVGHNPIIIDDSTQITIVHPYSKHNYRYKEWMSRETVVDGKKTYVDLDLFGDSKGYGTEWAIEGLDSFKSDIEYDSASAPDTIALPVYRIKPTGEKEPIDTIVLTAVNNELLQNYY